MQMIAKPFGMLLMWLYEVVANYGVAIILFAIIVKVLLLPFQMKSKRGSMQQSRLAPKLKEIEKRCGGDKRKYQEEQMKFYKEEGINPTSGCLWALLPFPILFALYYAVRQPLTTMMGMAGDLLTRASAPFGTLIQKLLGTGFAPSLLKNASFEILAAEHVNNNWAAFESFGNNLRRIDFHFLGINLAQTPHWDYLWNNGGATGAEWTQGFFLFLIPFISAGLTMLQMSISMKQQPQQEGQPGMGKSMLLMQPIMSLYFAFIMPAALGIYWAIGAVLQIIQDTWLTRHYTKILDAEDVERNKVRAAKAAEIERKRKETEQLRAENQAYSNPNVSKRRLRLTEKQERAQKQAEWERTHAPEKQSKREKEESPSRVGNRPFARGRAYDPNRFGDSAQLIINNEELIIEDEDEDYEEPETAGNNENDEDFEYENDNNGGAEPEIKPLRGHDDD
ncbi:MAG: membrane protein insertase YidC [Oscillospiraceae bacterium]|jgi:YidC/Oxa1 family membrane protein insertase|nr:membrane protein insertase YidC [Oscillospiraceae bacterium]